MSILNMKKLSHVRTEVCSERVFPAVRSVLLLTTATDAPHVLASALHEHNISPSQESP